MNEKKSYVWLWVLLGGAAFVFFCIVVLSILFVSLNRNSYGEYSASSGFGDKIGVIDIEGIILEAKPTITEIRKFADDDSIKAIILRLNTPGGGAAASQEIYRAVRRARVEKKKKIVAAVETVGASGGYYIASGTEKIYADPASIVGSIGVIAEWVNYGDLMRWAKLKDITMKAGSLKDAGSPTRDMTPEERAYLQGLIDNMHQQFIHDVAEGRGMKETEIRSIANGRVWTGEQALPLKLVDKLGGFQEAVEETARAVGIRGEPTLVRPEKERHSVLDLLTGDVSQYLPDRAKMLQTNPGFYFLWK